MSNNFGLWAQSLDNFSPDEMSIDEKQLLPDDKVKRENLVSEVSHIVATSPYQISEDGIKLTANETHFLLEVISSKCDNAGRAAPIICYGNYDNKSIDSLTDLVFESLNNFARQINRDIPSICIPQIKDMFVKLKKRKKRDKYLRYSVVAAVSAVVGFVALDTVDYVRKNINRNKTDPSDKENDVSIVKEDSNCRDIAEQDEPKEKG